MTTTNPALWSQHFDMDLTRAPAAVRTAHLGEIIKLGRDHGVTIRHRASGWSTETTSGERKNWWPAQANLFADYVADEVRAALKEAQAR